MRILLSLFLLFTLTTVNAQESATIDESYTNVQRDSRNANYGTLSMFDKTATGQRVAHPVNGVTVKVYNINGGPINGTVTVTPVGGHVSVSATAASTSVNATTNTDTTGVSVTLSPNPNRVNWHYVQAEGEGVEPDLVTNHPVSSPQSFSVVRFIRYQVSYSDNNGGGGDSITVQRVVTISGTYGFLTNSGGTYNSNTAYSIPLYTNGPPPEGREDPGGGVTYDEPETTEDTFIEGTVTNFSDDEKTIGIYKDPGDGSAPEFVGDITVAPGGSIPVDLGYDLEPGESLLFVTDGQAVGSADGVVGHEGTANFDLTFPPQELSDQKFIFVNSGPEQTVVLGHDLPQEFVPVPTGSTSIGREFSGTPQITGGEIIGTTSNGTTIVGVPDSSAASVTGTATVVGANGQSTQATIVTSSSGESLTVGANIPTTPVTTPDQQGGTNMSGGSTSSGSGADSITAIFNQIKAELAAAALGATAVEGTDSQVASEGGARITAIQDTVDQVSDLGDELEEDGDDGTIFGIDPQFTAVGGDRSNTYTFAMLGTNYTMVFDHPLIGFFRSLLLTIILLMWMIFLIKFAKG